MMTLTSRLVDVRCKLNQKEDENARLKKDCELSVQLLQCAPASNYLTHKVSMLPHDLQYRVHKVMAEEFTTPSPDTVEPLLYTPNEDAPNLAGRVYDRVSTAVIARAMKMREDDTQNNKCVPATIIKKDLSNIGTQTIQPYQGSLSAKTRRNSVTNDRGIQADLGKESLENCIEGTETGNDSDIPSNINGKHLSPSHRSPQRTTPSSPPPNLLDDIVDLIDFSQPSSQSNDVSVNESVISNSHPSQTSRNSSRRSSTESNSDSIVGGINSRRSSSSSNHSSSSSQNRKSDSHNVLNTNKQRIGRHSSREMEYGPDLIQASPPPTTSHYQPFKFHTRGGGPGQIGKARGPMKPGMFAAHHQNHPGGVGGVRMHYNTPPASPGHPNIVNKISTQTDV
ncbi:uncharacterized protein LOC102803706 [Saccoglossus kowalevskii]|uniref:Phosphatidylinositol 3,4,5-trisphosphate 3-phosphatase cnrN-like n=1 Tax=Saccoglossus kowalevskii TaxID=10224 RepID=A0ABM0MTX7_SACKO|nr:PREDICTED: phosphatidylinositol 3,4,5-trisphosphate 3-phosphatase cnrN-like [Saccoglossus kowalevskii]